MEKFISFNFLLFSILFALTFTACQKDSLTEEMHDSGETPSSQAKKLTKEDAKIILEESLKNTSQEFTANLFNMAVQMSESLQAENNPANNIAVEDIEFDFTCDALVYFNLFNFNYDDEFGLINKEFNSDLSYRVNCVTDTLFQLPNHPPVTFTYPVGGDLFIDTEASCSAPTLESDYTSTLQSSLIDMLNIFNAVTQDPVTIEGTYTSNGEITYHRDENTTIITNATTDAILTGLTFNTWTKEVESGSGTFNYLIQNDTGSVSFEGSMEVTDINELTFFIGDEILFVLPIGDILDQIFG